MTNPDRPPASGNLDRSRLVEWATLVGDDLPEGLDPEPAGRE